MVIFDVSVMAAVVAFESGQSRQTSPPRTDWMEGERSELLVEGADGLEGLPVGERISREHELRQRRWFLREAETEKARSFVASGLLVPRRRSEARKGRGNTELDRRAAARSLKRVIEASIHAAYHEERESMRHTLKMAANELKAQYGQIRRQMCEPAILSDYWVAWAVLSSAAAGTPVDSSLAGYSSRGVRRRMNELIRAVNGVILQKDIS